MITAKRTKQPFETGHNILTPTPVVTQQVRDELDRDEGIRRGEEQPRHSVRQVHTPVSGEHPQQVQEDHTDHGDVAHTDAVPSARVHPGAGQHAGRLPEGVVRAVLHVRVHMVVRGGHLSRTGDDS